MFKKKLEALRPSADVSITDIDFDRVMGNAHRIARTRRTVMDGVVTVLSSARASIILSAAIALAVLSVLAVFPRAKHEHEPKPKLESQIPDDRIPDRRNLRNVDLNAGQI
ncbi:MAG: hypothetical protein AABZ39_20495 [Spirochaetota bacterium]